jgi:Arc/MetJ-type ribon-helix-helix transcriptional regulator
MMKNISVKIPEALIEGMDELVKLGMYPNKSEIIRAAIRDLLRKELWKKY